MLFLTMYSGTNFARAPVKTGDAPSTLEIVKRLVGREDKTVRGSLKSFRVSSPVLTNDVVI